MTRLLRLFILCLSFSVACSLGGGDSGGDSQRDDRRDLECESDEPCDCPVGDGLRYCSGGTLGACECPDTPADCGDGVRSGDETCDGNAAICSDALEYEGLADCLEDCSGWGECEVEAYCGDGKANGIERCDDGEQCDIPNGCRCDCKGDWGDPCGDGIVGEGEECDDGNLADDCACLSDCKLPFCGDGRTCDDEVCEIGQSPLCDDGCYGGSKRCSDDCAGFGPCDIGTQRCGNGAVEGCEVCDDGDPCGLPGGCLCDCSGWVQPVCGNGALEAGEECDDGGVRVGDGCDASCRIEIEPAPFLLSSPAFTDGGYMPHRFTCDEWGNYVRPSFPLEWSGFPAETQSFVLLMDDLTPSTSHWVHWLVINLPATTTSLAEDASENAMPAGSEELHNSWHWPGYGGPCPVSGPDTFRIQLFALADPSIHPDWDWQKDRGDNLTLELKSIAIGLATMEVLY